MKEQNATSESADIVRVPREATPITRGYSYSEVAAIFRVSERTVMRWVKEGRCPGPVYFNTRAVFSPETVSEIERGLQPKGTHANPVSIRAANAQEAIREKLRRDGRREVKRLTARGRNRK